MKYIRTVNGVYDIDNASKYLTMCNTEQEFDNLSKKNSNCFYINTDKNVVCSKQHGQLIVTPYIKSADTLKELIDTYVGAIWITGASGEPILKSVALMNAEGELELL